MAIYQTYKSFYLSKADKQLKIFDLTTILPASNGTEQAENQPGWGLDG